MAKVKTAPAAIDGVGIVNSDRAPIAGNPHTWLPLLGDAPGGNGLRILYGVLRPNYRGWSNTAVAFGRAKLQISAPAGLDPWAITAVRAEVLLPEGADDRYASPRTLLEAVDEPGVAPKAALLAYATITWPTQRLHEQYEAVRDVLGEIVRRFGCPALLVQHAPHLARSDNPHHCHCLVVPQRLTSLGWARLVPTLGGDKGRQLFVDGMAARLAE